jgi:WXXGXW repeat (2 copies)
MKTRLMVAALALAGAALTACGGGGYYSVRYGPPAPRYGVVGYAPGRGFVWTDGYWDWRGSNWYWVGGRWQRPPRVGAVWVSPAWRQYGNRYRFHRGYWH